MAYNKYSLMLGYPLILCYNSFANSTLNKVLSYSLYSLTVHLRASEYIISLGVILQLEDYGLLEILRNETFLLC